PVHECIVRVEHERLRQVAVLAKEQHRGDCAGDHAEREHRLGEKPPQSMFPAHCIPAGKLIRSSSITRGTLRLRSASRRTCSATRPMESITMVSAARPAPNSASVPAGPPATSAAMAAASNILVRIPVKAAASRGILSSRRAEPPKADMAKANRLPNPFLLVPAARSG